LVLVGCDKPASTSKPVSKTPAIASPGGAGDAMKAKADDKKPDDAAAKKAADDAAAKKAADDAAAKKADPKGK
jgi:hypothetical protein